MSADQTTAYSTARIARAADMTPRAVRKGLADISEARLQVAAGGPAKAWALAALPKAMQEALEKQAEARGYRNAEHLLSEAGNPWQSPIPLKELSPESLDKAVRLMRVLKPILPGYATGNQGELLGRALEAYAKEFGYAISLRHLRNLVARALQRDANRADWERIELYLPDKLRRLPSAAAVTVPDPSFDLVTDCLAGMKDPLKPSSDEKALLWERAFLALEEMSAAGMAERKSKARLLDFLHQRAFWLAESREALRVNFERKRAKWLAGGRNVAALLDQRHEKGGKPVAEPFAQDDLDKIAWHAGANCGGRLAQGVRELDRRGELSPQLSNLLAGDKHSKSYVPQRLRAAVKPDVFWVNVHHQGRKALDLVRPTMNLSYEGIHSMDALTADDFTMPVYWYEPDGKGWFDMVRGQCLLVQDWRSACFLGFSLQPDPQYNSVAIRGVFSRVFDQHGLPKKLYLERGIWYSSKLISGGEAVRQRLREGDFPHSVNEIEVGFRRFGVEFIHARGPRGKSVIERGGGLLQDRMEGDPGYCGREEKRDLPDRIKSQLADVRAGKVHPSKHFHSFDQWIDRLEQIMKDFNGEPQEGKRLAGLSPAQAFEEYWNDADPPVKFGDQCRFLLALHVVPGLEVKPSGISFKPPGAGQKHCYLLDAQATALLGQRVKGWYNPEIPERCTFTDMDGHNPFTLERQIKVNGLGHDPDALAAGMEQINSSLKYGRIKYRLLSQKFARKQRLNVVGQEVIELGQEIKARAEAAKADGRALARVRRMAAALGAPSPTRGEDVARSIEALEWEKRARAKIESQSKRENHNEPTT